MRYGGLLFLLTCGGLSLSAFTDAQAQQTAPRKKHPSTRMESISNQKKSLKALLEEKQDKRRVLLLYGRDTAQHWLIEQQEALHQHTDAMTERDLDVFVLVASELQEPDRWYLTHSDFKLVPGDDFQGWLIGKDGGIKHTFTKPVEPNELFRIIDSMPMRRQEMKKQ